MNCIHIVGNRPQFIKLALLHRAVAEHTGFKQQIIHTGQHYDAEMSDVFFSELNIPVPDYQLSINQLPHFAQIGRMTEEIGAILVNEPNNSGVIVYGDTNTTLAGALAAKKVGLRIAHVESGIRTLDEKMPEESNRYLTDRIAELNFCPTLLCVENLQKEGFASDPSKKTYHTGDIMLDAWKYAQTLETGNYRVPDASYTLATIHREENNGNPEKLAEIIKGLNVVNKSVPVIMPCHPGTRQKIAATGVAVDFDLRAPFSYLEMMSMLHAATYVITDSGGFCREAFFSHKPSLAIMERPFWPEIINTGTCLATSAKQQDIINQFAVLQTVKKDFDVQLFGNGNAALKMANILQEEWN